MFAYRWQSGTAFAVLLTYTVLLTVGPSLHEHGHHRADLTQDCCSTSTCCTSSNPPNAAQASDASRQSSGEDTAQRFSAPREIGASVCMICRFLTQKPAPTGLVRVVCSTPLVERPEIIPSTIPCQLFCASGDIRAPPTIS